jgi:hypothetical protein
LLAESLARYLESHGDQRQSLLDEVIREVKASR